MIKTDLVQDMIKRAEEGIKILALEYVFGFRNVIPTSWSRGRRTSRA